MAKICDEAKVAFGEIACKRFEVYDFTVEYDPEKDYFWFRGKSEDDMYCIKREDEPAPAPDDYKAWVDKYGALYKKVNAEAHLLFDKNFGADPSQKHPEHLVGLPRNNWFVYLVSDTFSESYRIAGKALAEKLMADVLGEDVLNELKEMGFGIDYYESKKDGMAEVNVFIPKRLVPNGIGTSHSSAEVIETPTSLSFSKEEFWKSFCDTFSDANFRHFAGDNEADKNLEFAKKHTSTKPKREKGEER